VTDRAATSASVIPPRQTRRLIVFGLVASWLVAVLARSPWFESGAGPLARGLLTIGGLLSLAYFATRNYRAARAIADDADGNLDERQLALRNRTYLDAYRVVGAAVVTWSAYLSIAADSSRFWFPSSSYVWTVCFESTLILAIFTPSVLFTWREPDLALGDDA
jgi:hypothetical protein